MIKGMHAMLYTTQAAELRAFFRDKLGVHPTDGNPPSGHPDVSFYCDDIVATRAELEGPAASSSPTTPTTRDTAW